ncbi:MAG: restriction endonuclease [Chloroflexi bacterium]|nr:restriction endonuclease [Chloroflexota bacterium]
MALCQGAYPDINPKTIINWVGQLWAFVNRIQVGDLIVLPLKSRAAIAIGRSTGPYRHLPDLPPDARHTRTVEWLQRDIPRTAFDQDLLYSLGAFMTVCQIRRNNAEERIKTVLDGRPSAPAVPRQTEAAEPDEEALPNLEEYAQDQIRAYIDRKYKGHDLARLVTAVLKAQGYRTYTASPGPDGGADIMAGRGPMGFDPPRLCVQVKSGSQPADVRVLRELQGVMRNFGAEQGLLVSWGGFKSTVFTEASRLFFQIRLWDSGDIVQNLLEHYDQLPEDLQAELPLKRIWTLVQEEAE